MFNAVYSHKTVFGFEELARRVIKLLIRENEIYSSKAEIEGLVVDESSAFLEFDDGYLDKLIRKHAYRSEGGNGLLKLFCRAIMDRKPPKLIYEVKDLRPDGGHLCKGYVLFEKYLERYLMDLARECGIDPDHLFWREPKDVNFEAAHPFVSLSRIKDGIDPRELRELVRIVDRNGNITNLVEEPTSVIYHLSRLTAKSIRLYGVGVPQEKRMKLTKIIEEHVRGGTD